MAKLLFLSSHLPSPEVREAGQKTAFRNLQCMADIYEIYLVCFQNEIEKKCDLSLLEKLCKSIKIFSVSNISRLIQICKNPELPVLVAARYNKAYDKYLTGLNAEHKFQRVHCEYGQTAVYAGSISNTSIKTINLHDVLTQWSLRRWESCKKPLLKAYYKKDYYRSMIWEKKAYGDFSVIYVPSNKDANFLHSVHQSFDKKIRLLPPYFAGAIDKETSINNEKEKSSIVFFGAMNRMENEEAVIWFVEKIFPLIKQREPNAKLYIVGNAPSNRIKCYANGDVIVTGFVGNPQEYLTKAQIAVIPLLTGAGIKVKTLECLAAGLPVVATDIGSEGVDATRDDGLISVKCNDVRSFADEVCTLLRDMDLCHKLGSKASVWTKNVYSFDSKVLMEI
jgi:glycosyltransferase involved in cell wall biosynthesis